MASIFKKCSKLLILLSCTIALLITFSQAQETIKVGWIGPLSGPLAKYGTYQSAVSAQDKINSSGGINGKQLELIFEDGKGEGLAAAQSAQKLVNLDKVKYIVGGHCSPESLAMAPILERSKVVMLAAITSSPHLTNAGDYIFRVTAVSTRVADMLAPYAMEKLNLKSIAILYAETDYARPPAEHFAELVKKSGNELIDFQSFNPSEIDFRTILAKMKVRKVDGIYLGVQAPDSALLILKQLKVLGIKAKVFGNEVTGNSVSSFPEQKDLFEGLGFAEPPFNPEKENTKAFIQSYKERFKVGVLPFGFWTAEAYDAVMIMADVIRRCGEDVEMVKECLYKIKNYDGVSGPISIDENGDGVREYVLKKVVDGKGIVLSE